MIKQYLSQAWRILKENPILSAISILGTALAICMIMVIVMTYEIKNAPMAPEVNRDRMLYMKWMSSKTKGENGSNNSLLGRKIAKEAFLPLQTPEAVTIVTPSFEQVLTKAPGSDQMHTYNIMSTDANFWKIFKFHFLAGKPYSGADVQSALPKVVISKKVAQETFGSITDAVGKEIQINYNPYTVVGIVQDVSTLMSATYSQIWTPLEAIESGPDSMDGANGPLRVYILAHNKSDFPKIKDEVEKLRKQFMADPSPIEVMYRGQPDEQFVANLRSYANVRPDIKGYVRKQVILLLLILLVPAINLFDMCTSQMRRRLAELGVRRAYGAKRRDIIMQVVSQSFLQSLLGGALGLVFAIFAAYVSRDLLLGDYISLYAKGEMTIPLRQLLNPVTFLLALLFCLLLNLLSSLIPAYKVSKHKIIDALNSLK